MKLLIYGIDGGDLAVLQKFPMPFLRKFLEDNASIELKSDLINRGWAEILTGKGGHETGAFYMAPTLDGTHRLSISFRMSQLEGREDIKPMWKLFEERGLPFLIMNVPTTTPAPKVTNGVVIGSAGGGLNKIEGIPPQLVSDESVIPTLEGKNYIVDIRIPNSEYATTSDMLDDLIVMEERRTDCFIDLCQQRGIEAGFLCNRGTTITGYLASSEIESYDAYNTLEEFMPRHEDKSWIHKKLEEHYEMLDRQLERLYTELKPDHFIITADHGMVPHRYRANASAFLKQHGYTKQKESAPLIKWLRAAKNWLGFRKTTPGLMKKIPGAFDLVASRDWRKTKAFGHRYIPGIYINDSRRFAGPVSEASIDSVVDEIVETFNMLDTEERKGMRAVPYRRRFDGPHTDKLPDIKFEDADGIFFNEGVEKLIYPNPRYGPVPLAMAEVDSSDFTGTKGDQPLCVVTKNTANLVRSGDARDLTLIYHLADRATCQDSEQ